MSRSSNGGLWMMGVSVPGIIEERVAETIAAETRRQGLALRNAIKAAARQRQSSATLA
jgi:hypothetical protein